MVSCPVDDVIFLSRESENCAQEGVFGLEYMFGLDILAAERAHWGAIAFRAARGRGT